MEKDTSCPSWQNNRTENIPCIFWKITHLFLLIPNPPEQFMKEITQNCCNFIWNVMEGGLGMLDIPMFVKSVKITWVRRLFTAEANWKYLTEYRCKGILDVARFGNDYVRKIQSKCRPPFWSDILVAFRFYLSNFLPVYWEQFQCEPMHYKRRIKTAKKTVSHLTWIKHGILQVRHRCRRIISYSQRIHSNVPNPK